MAIEVEVVGRVLGTRIPCLGLVNLSAALPQLRTEVHDSHHESGLGVLRTGEDGSRNVRRFLGEISLDHNVAVLKLAQAEPVGVCLPLNLGMMSHVQLAVLLEVRPQVAELALLLHYPGSWFLKWLLPRPL